MPDNYVKEISMEKLEVLKADYALRRHTVNGIILQMETLAYEDRFETIVVTSKGHTINYITYISPTAKQDCEDIIKRIDKRLGKGWTKKLADVLSENAP